MRFDSIELGLAPLISPPFVVGLAIIGVIAWVWYVKNKGAAPVSRFSLLSLVILLLLEPTLSKNVNSSLPDVIAIVHDQSSSMRATNRLEGAHTALTRLTKALEKLPNTVVKTASIAESVGGTRISGAINQATSGYVADQIAAVIYLGDGLVIDGSELAKPYPLHQILIADESEKDRLIELISSPIAVDVGQNAEVVFKVTESRPQTDFAQVRIYLGNLNVRTMNVKINHETKINIPINVRGKIPIAIEVAPAQNEVTTNNNIVISQIEGTRNRLQVLLVTGSPYEGARAWRNLLKSDPNVELVHFTILRNAQSEDVGDESESSLIPFPTEELFLDKLNGFDLIVFDRFKRIDILPDLYLEQVAQWVENGGAFLLLAGPAEAEENGILTTPLARVMPFANPKEFNEAMFSPRLSPSGASHPITRPFITSQNTWGQWNRLLHAEPLGDVLLNAGGAPLLITKEANQGRVAAILSDRSWLWQRGFEGGGPFRALFQRVAHWLMKEPELSSNNLDFTQENGGLRFVYSGLLNEPEIEIISPSQNHSKLKLAKNGSNEFHAVFSAAENGLYRIKLGQDLRFINMGDGPEITAQDLRASHQPIRSAAGATNGGKYAYIGRAGNGNLPNFKQISTRELAIGNMFALKKNNYHTVVRAQSEPLLPPLGMAIAMACLALFTWWREGVSPRR